MQDVYEIKYLTAVNPILGFDDEGRVLEDRAEKDLLCIPEKGPTSG
jgi:hypothetical protein